MVRSRSLRTARCGPDDLAEVDDLLLGVGEVAHDLLGLALEDVLLEALELVADLPQHREAVVERVVDDLVEQVAAALGQQGLAGLLGRAAALEQVLHRRERRVGERDQEVGADEDVELGGVQAPDGLVEHREVENDEQVVVVLVDLRALVAGEHVLVVERVELEVLLEPGPVHRPRALDVDPAQAGMLDELDVRLSGAAERADSTRARAERLRRGFGRLGITSERVVQHGHPVDSTSCAWYPARLHSRCIERGGGKWPGEAPATAYQ